MNVAEPSLNAVLTVALPSLWLVVVAEYSL